jgi:hypothetical protein
LFISDLGKGASRESMFLMTFDYTQQQTNRLIEYLFNGPHSKYLMRPTQALQNMFDAQFNKAGVSGDQYRGGENRTIRTMNGDKIFFKLIRSKETAAEEYKNDQPVTLYRASDIHFFVVEALLGLERYEAASRLFETGVQATDVNTVTGGTYFKPPVEDFPSCLFVSTSNEYFNLGIRGRVDLGKVMEPVYKDITLTDAQKRFKLDSLVVVETCMESAGEARSLPAMIRAAKRHNNPAFVADIVSAKYPAGQREVIRAKLQDPANWYIKYDLKK